MTRNWQREMLARDNQAYAMTRDTEFWRQAMRELQMTPADLDNTNNMRLVAARAQALKDAARGDAWNEREQRNWQLA